MSCGWSCSFDFDKSLDLAIDWYFKMMNGLAVYVAASAEYILRRITAAGKQKIIDKALQKCVS